MMEAILQWIGRVRAWFRHRELDRELDQELSFHIELAAEEHLQAGLSPEQARRRALQQLGGVEQAKERHRQARGLGLVEEFARDLRYAVRTLRRERGFAVIAVFILALGIGANTAVFSVVETLLLRSLPLAQAQQLVWIAPPPAKCGFSCATFSADAFEEFGEEAHTFQDVAGYFAFSTEDNYRLTGHGEPVPATGIYVTASFFQVLGVKPALGRWFGPGDATKSSAPAALLAYAYWTRQFGADPGIVGRTIDLNGRPVMVAGVLPQSFDFGALFSPGERVDLFTPYILDNWRDDGNDLTMLGRLKPGVSLTQAQADVNSVMPRLYFNRKDPGSKGQYEATLTPLKDYVVGRVRAPLIMLWGAVGAILLLVCVNLSGLVLARATSRIQEFTLRSALGAGRMRIVRQLLAETLVLAAAGAALGLGVAAALVSGVAHQGSIALPLLGGVRLDGTALAWTLLLAVGVAALTAVAPSIRVSSRNLHNSLKGAGTGTGHGAGYEYVRAVLVVAEVAMACVLLVAAGLLLRSFLRVLDVNLGFQPAGAAAIKLDYDDHGSAAKRVEIFSRILNRVGAIPGVEAGGIADFLPLGHNRSWGPLKLPGQPARRGTSPAPLVYVVTPGFFRAMGIPIVAGRDFSWSDGPNSRKVIVINQATASALWPSGGAVGRMVMGPDGPLLVIGVVADVREESPEAARGSQAYYPAGQNGPEGAVVVIRTQLPPASLSASVLAALRQLNPSQPAAALQPIQQIVDHAVSPRRFFMLLVTSFGAFGLLLALLGVYGVISYSVTRRTREMGIRMALGASPASVRRLVLRATLRLALFGVAIGLAGSFAVARSMASLLYQTSPADAFTLTAAAGVLAAAALLAGYIPARRASRVEPMTALRIT
ncbi:MAG: ADOP family duplicated permease [Terriglobales bacterium]